MSGKETRVFAIWALVLVSTFLAAVVFSVTAATVASHQQASMRAQIFDIGTAGDLAEVRSAASQLLTADLAPQRLTSHPLSESQHTEALRDVWIDALAEARALEVSTAMAKFSDDPEVIRFTNNRFVVTNWQGAWVIGERAYVQLLGRHEYQRRAGVWHSAPTTQWQLSLVRELGSWQLERVDAVSLESGR